MTPQRHYLLLGLSLFVLFGLLFFSLSKTEDFTALPNIEVVESSDEEGTWLSELPVRLVIPDIGVDAKVQYVGLEVSGSGEMAVPSNFTDVGWYKGGVRPGQSGSAVVAGHYNGKGVPEAVFYDLQAVEVGDEIVIISADQAENIFSVVDIKTYDYNETATDVFHSSDGKARLNLITCGGEWLSEEHRYDKRVVIFSELVTDIE